MFWIGIGLVLIFLARRDALYMKVPIKVVLPVIILSLLYRLISFQDLKIYLLGAAIGIIAILIGCITRSIGIGDGCVIVITGLALGLQYNLILLLLSFISALVVFLFSKKKTLPFIPFITGVYICLVIILVTKN